MKNLLLLLYFIPLTLSAQQEVPPEYWLDDSNYETTINGNSAFGDDDNKIIVVEYWAKFNEVNCYPHWEELANRPDVEYYRVDISKAPLAKKKYRVRMAPTIMIFNQGSKEKVFKAGLDLLLPTDLNEIQESIIEINKANKF